LIVFTQWPQDSTGRLYVCAPSDGEQGWIGYLLPQGTDGKPIGLNDALTQRNGSFLFSAWDAPLSTEAETEAFLKAVIPLVPPTPERGFMWLTDPHPEQMNGNTVSLLQMDAGGTQTTAGLAASLAHAAGMLNFSLGGGLKLGLSPDGASFVLTGSNPTMIQFTGQMAPVVRPILSARLPFMGAERGCLTLANAFILRRSLAVGNAMRTGFQFVYPNPDKQQVQQHLSGWYPLLDQNQKLNDSIGFNICLDLTDPENVSWDPAKGLQKRTCFAFTGANFDKQPTELYTNYTTRSGYPVQIQPVIPAAGSGERQGILVLHAGPADGPVTSAFLFSPDGDYTLTTAGTGADITAELLCGLSGTESVRFTRGDRIRFLSGQPAYAASYPFQTASTVGPPVNANGDVLKPDFRTSWATVLSAPKAASDGSGNFYLAQPLGATLYGKETLNRNYQGLLFGFEDTSMRMAAESQAFPLVPYSGVTAGGPGSFALEDYRVFERQVVAPSRRYRVQTVATTLTSLSDSAPNGTYQATTPSGLLLSRNGDRFADVLLAHPPEGPDMRFVNLTAELQQALQTNQLFLVAANAKYLGQPGGEPSADPSFYNRVGIGGWQLSADVGQCNRYTDYSNVLIVKGRRGQTLADLAGHPEIWTQAAELAAPSDLRDKPDGTTEIGEPDPGEIVVLAQWIQAYIERAQSETDPFFARFQQIAADPDWTGILVLQASVNQFPDELKGLQGGLDGGNLYAHHLGVDITPVNKDLSVTQPSSLFGLIYYLNPAYLPDEPLQMVAPDPGDYDFKLLTLKVLFDKAAVQDFRSLAQLTINRFFNQPVTGMGDTSNTFNSILLQGSYQHHDGKSYYVLDTFGDNIFKFSSNLLNKIEIVKAQFNTVGSVDGANGKRMMSRFGLWGFIDFKPFALTASDGKAIPFDLFSFGSREGSDAARNGLYFAGMTISMAYPEDKPTNHSFAFETGNMSFDTSLSTPPRPTSLYQAFPLEIQDVLNGDAARQPSEFGFLPVGAGSNLIGLGDRWYGLRFRLNLGTAGELAGKLGLNAYLLLAWSADDGTDPINYKSTVGLQLPGTGDGAKLFSLQGVLKLAIGNILLRYDTKAEAFVLSFTEIALKFLGLLKLPPNGATSLYLFGNPQEKDQGSSLGWYAIYKQPIPKE
jgi:hypothetical protein